MKKWLFVFLAALLVSGGSANVQAQNVGESFYEAFIKVNENFKDYLFEAAGAQLTAKYDGFYTARIRSDVQPSTLRAIEGVEHVSPAITLLTCTDSARYYSRVENVQLGRGLDMPYTGKGVIVGVIDCGFDFNHINLCDSNGNTRVKAVYMPLDNSGV